jgi:hypothetical protein
MTSRIAGAQHQPLFAAFLQIVAHFVRRNEAGNHCRRKDPRWRYGKRVRAAARHQTWIMLRRFKADRASDVRQASFSFRSIGKQSYSTARMRPPNEPGWQSSKTTRSFRYRYTTLAKGPGKSLNCRMHDRRFAIELTAKRGRVETQQTPLAKCPLMRLKIRGALGVSVIPGSFRPFNPGRF